MKKQQVLSFIPDEVNKAVNLDREDVLFSDWIIKKKKEGNNKVEDRYVVVSSFALYSFAKPSLSSSLKLKRKGFFLDLLKITTLKDKGAEISATELDVISEESENYSCKFEFKDFAIEIGGSKAFVIASLVKSRVMGIQINFPPERTCVYQLPLSLMREIPPPLSPLGGFINTYISVCGAAGVPAGKGFLKYLDDLALGRLQNSYEDESKILNLAEGSRLEVILSNSSASAAAAVSTLATTPSALSTAQAASVAATSSSNLHLPSILEALWFNTHFNHLVISPRCKYDKHTIIEHIARLVLLNKSLVVLQASELMADRGFAALSQSFTASATTSALAMISLSGSSIKESGMKELVSGLPSLPSLLCLDISFCEISSQGLVDLAVMLGLLKIGKRLVALNLAGNPITRNTSGDGDEEGVRALCRWLSGRESKDKKEGRISLRTLILHDTDIDVGALSDALVENMTSISVLDIGGCILNTATQHIVVKYLCSTTTLTELDISGLSVVSPKTNASAAATATTATIPTIAAVPATAAAALASILRSVTSNSKLATVSINISGIEVHDVDVSFGVFLSSNNLEVFVGNSMRIKSPDPTFTLLQNLIPIPSLQRLYLSGLPFSFFLSFSPPSFFFTFFFFCITV